MYKKILSHLKSLKVLIILLLSTTIIALIIGLATVTHRLGAFEKSYELNGQDIICTAHEKTINALSEEIVSLKSQLQAKNSNTETRVKADISAFLAAYYNINSQNYRVEDTLNAISPLVSDTILKQLTPVLDPHIESLSPEDETFPYYSSVEIKDFYFKEVSNSKATALILCDVTIKTKWGEDKQHLLIQASADYDSQKKRWIITGLSGTDNIELNSIIP